MYLLQCLLLRKQRPGRDYFTYSRDESLTNHCVQRFSPRDSGGLEDRRSSEPSSAWHHVCSKSVRSCEDILEGGGARINMNTQESLWFGVSIIFSPLPGVSVLLSFW